MKSNFQARVPCTAESFAFPGGAGRGSFFPVYIVITPRHHFARHSRAVTSDASPARACDFNSDLTAREQLQRLQ